MPSILLIEDDQPLRRAICLSLEKSGYVVLEACDGGKGLAVLKTHPVNLVITDMLMPDVEGVETIRELRKYSSNLPIIAISGGGRASPTSYLTIATKLGANKVFEKPVEPDVLCAAVEQLLGVNGTVAK